MDLVCIVCPRGCRLKIENGEVSGNFCKKGLAFAMSETECPMRTVCSTVATAFSHMPVLPVKTNGEIPRAKIKDLMKLINEIKVDKKLKMGDVVASNILDTNIDLIATASIY